MIHDDLICQLKRNTFLLDSARLVLDEDAAWVAEQAVTESKTLIKRALSHPGLTLVETRNNEQNKKLHATLTEVAKQKEWAGQKWEVEVWKRLMTAAWMRARGERIMVVPALDGQGVDVVFRRTSSLTKSECGELLEFVMAWCVENDVECAA